MLLCTAHCTHHWYVNTPLIIVKYVLTIQEQSQLQPAQYYTHPAITRYFDHVQNRPSVRKAAEALAPAFSLVAFDLDNTPHQERKAEPPKKKEKAAPAAAAPVAKADKAAKSEKAAVKGKEGEKAAEDSAPKEGKAQKKEKKAKEPKEPKAAEKKPAADDAGEPVPSMIDLRVGHIVDSESVGVRS